MTVFVTIFFQLNSNILLMTIFNFQGLFPGHSYQFRVCAVNEIGDSDFVTSETVQITEDSAGRYREYSIIL